MNKHYIYIVAVIGSSLLGAAPVAVADPTDSMLASLGEFQLRNGDTKTVMRGAAIKAYRVCMDEGAEAVPLKVTYDGMEVLVEPGECQLIQARTIKLASAARLHNGMTLIGSFDAGSKKKYQTNVSLAQAARND